MCTQLQQAKQHSQGEGVGVYQVWGRNVSQEAWSHWDSGGRWTSAQWWSAPPSLEWLCSASGRSPGHCLSGTLAPCKTWNTHKRSCAYSLVWILLWVLPTKVQITAFLKHAKPKASTSFLLLRAFSAVSKSSDHSLPFCCSNPYWLSLKINYLSGYSLSINYLSGYFSNMQNPTKLSTITNHSHKNLNYSSSSNNWILMSCQPHRVTSGQSNSGHKQIHISKLFSHIFINPLSSIYKNQSLCKHKTYIHKFSMS